MLPSKSSPKISTAKLAQQLAVMGYEVSLRTVQRDLEDLALEYPDIECDKSSKPYAWGWVKDKVRISVPGMDTSQALSLRLLNSHLADLLPDQVLRELRPLMNEANRVLSERFNPTIITKWADKNLFQTCTPILIKPKIQTPVQEVVTQALLHDNKINLSYACGGETELIKQVAYPLGLIHQGIVQYLVLCFDGETKVTHLPMHQIKKAIMLEEKGKAPKGFQLKKYQLHDIQGFSSEATASSSIKLVAKLAKNAALYLNFAPVSSDQKLTDTPDGQIRLTATVDMNDRLVSWLMSYGENLIVEQPQHLRDLLSERIKKAAKAYK